MRFKSRSSHVLAAALTALGLVACGPASAPPSAETPAPAAPSPAPAAQASAEPVLLEIRDAAGAQLSGNAQVGARVFRGVCASCHAVTPGMNGSGPTLHGIVGRTAGTVAGFTYSEANRTSGIVWSQQELFDYLERPSAKIPNTTMIFAGVRQPQQRADLIAYLSEQQ
jgi:cytochrome c